MSEWETPQFAGQKTRGHVGEKRFSGILPDSFQWSNLRQPRALLGLAILVGLCVLFVRSLVTPPPAHASSSAKAHEPFEQIALYVWAAFVTSLLVRPLWTKQAQKHWDVFRSLRPLDFVQAAVVLAITLGVICLLKIYVPWLDRSWLYLLPGNDGDSANIFVVPATLPIVGLPFLMLLVLCLPMFAYREEVGYRLGTRDWRHGALRSLRFGLAHSFWAGIPLYIGLALTIGGLWFTFQFFKGGVERSTRHHLAYNLIAVTVVAIGGVYQIFHP